MRHMIEEVSQVVQALQLIQKKVVQALQWQELAGDGVWRFCKMTMNSGTYWKMVSTMRKNMVDENSLHEAAPVGNVAQTRLENQLVCEIGWRIKKIERVFPVDWGSLAI